MGNIIMEKCLAFLFIVYISDGRRITYPPPKMQSPATPRVHIVLNIVKMTEEILKDTNMKMRHIEKYVDMYRGKTSFEMGAAAGEMYARFKKMIRIYKDMTTIHPKKAYWWVIKDQWHAFNVFNNAVVEDMINAMQVLQGEYNEILYLRRVFYETIEAAHEARRKKLLELNRGRGGPMGPVSRRRSDSKQDDTLDDGSQMEQRLTFDRRTERPSTEGDPKDLYVDYWGHLVDRKEEERKMKERKRDRFDRAFREDLGKKVAEMFMGNHSFTHDELLSETSQVFARVEKRKQEIQKIKEENERMKQERAATRVSDDDFKRSLRLQSYERRRANFSPEREGIEINFDDMV